VPDAIDDEFVDIGQPELVPHMEDVGVDRAGGEVEPLCNLPGGQALGEQLPALCAHGGSGAWTASEVSRGGTWRG
jgi:hypothetical protein